MNFLLLISNLLRRSFEGFLVQSSCAQYLHNRKIQRDGGKFPYTSFPRPQPFCYKVEDYVDPSMLKRNLRHWDSVLKDQDWAPISSHSGWLTYEGIISMVMSNGLMDDQDSMRPSGKPV